MIYRGPGFRVVVWFGSSPTPSPLARQGARTRDTQEDWERETGVGAEVWERSQIIWRRESLVFYKLLNLLSGPTPAPRWQTFQTVFPFLSVSLTPAIILGFFGFSSWYQRHWRKMLSPVSLSPAIIVQQCRWYRRKINHSCRCHRRSLFSCVVDTCGKFIAGELSPAMIVQRRQPTLVINLSPVSTTPPITENPWQRLIAGVVDTVDIHSRKSRVRQQKDYLRRVDCIARQGSSCGIKWNEIMIQWCK